MIFVKKLAGIPTSCDFVVYFRYEPTTCLKSMGKGKFMNSNEKNILIYFAYMIMLK